MTGVGSCQNTSDFCKENETRPSLFPGRVQRGEALPLNCRKKQDRLLKRNSRQPEGDKNVLFDSWPVICLIKVFRIRVSRLLGSRVKLNNTVAKR